MKLTKTDKQTIREEDGKRFIAWLPREMDRQGVSLNELSRRTGMNRNAIHIAIRDGRCMRTVSMNAIRAALGKPDGGK